MSDSARIAAIGRTGTARSAAEPDLRIPLIAFGLSLGLFLAISYVLCVGFDLIMPNNTMHEVWQRLLPGFAWLTWPSFLLGLVESFAWGWYVTLVFGLPFNFFTTRIR